MRRVLVILSILATVAMAAGKQLISTGGEVPLYASQNRAVNEKATYTASSTETFIEVKRAGGKVQVRTKDGQELWADAKLIKEFSQSTGASMDLGAGKIDGYLDNPQAVYILQEDANAMAGLQLDRSFVDAIQGNMDREQTERRNSENN
ncbi:MAG: hypothetical protein RL173_3206 [Fibrobacterota bacterium]|jgi:hypothetical protein